MKPTIFITVFWFLLHPAKGQEQEIGKIANVNGFEMYYEVHGTGEPLILLHGFFSYGKFWDFCIDDFSKHYQLIVPDLRGHGRSTNPLEHWSMAQSARDIFALMDHLGIEEINGIGISTGAKTLLHMAYEDSEKIKSMVLIGGTMYYPEPCKKILAKVSVDHISEKDWEKNRAIHIHGDDQIRKLYRQFSECGKDYTDMAFTPSQLSTIQSKTLVMHGERDWCYPISMAIEMYESIPNSYLWIVPNGNHVPFLDNDLNLINRSAELFIHTTLEFIIKWD
jgi:pimeloyl-ACP methyl ester carboxylesterase